MYLFFKLRFYGGSFFLGYNLHGISKIANGYIERNKCKTLGGSILDYVNGHTWYENVTFS